LACSMKSTACMTRQCTIWTNSRLVFLFVFELNLRILKL
jgi:hypothetical protein